MAVGDRMGAEHINQTHPSREEWLSVAAPRAMLSRELRELRERTSSWES
jgi:hypothetical protein